MKKPKKTRHTGPPIEILPQEIMEATQGGDYLQRQLDLAVQAGLVPEVRLAWGEEEYAVLADLLADRGWEQAEGFFRLMSRKHQQRQQQARLAPFGVWRPCYPYKKRYLCLLCRKARGLSDALVCRHCHERHHAQTNPGHARHPREGGGNGRAPAPGPVPVAS